MNDFDTFKQSRDGRGTIRISEKCLSNPPGKNPVPWAWSMILVWWTSESSLRNLSIRGHSSVT